MPTFTPSPRLLFWGPTLIWASTWHVILYQLAEVPAMNAVAWRFLLASGLLFALAAWRGEAWRIAPRWHPWLALTGGVQYGVNYWCVYEAEHHIPSGLVAVLFALMVFGNALTGAWFFGKPITRRFVASAAVGVSGVALIFWPEIARAPAGAGTALGALFTVGAVLLSAVGSLSASRNRHHGLPFWPALGFGMLWGALASTLLALALGRGFALPGNAAWWLSLLYLALAGSVLTFACYLTLQDRLGPGPAGTIGVMTPLLALLVSLLFEGYRPEPLTFAGAALALAGNVAMLRPAKPAA